MAAKEEGMTEDRCPNRLAALDADKLRLQIADEFAFLRELLVAVVRTGTKDPLLDARIAEELRGHE